jgi:NHL repeat
MPQSGPSANVRPSCHAPVEPAGSRSAGNTERTPVRFCKPRRAGAGFGERWARLLVPVLCVLVGMLGVTAPAFAGLTHVYKGLSFGEEGAEPGQLNRPTGLAVNDATGEVYVVDAGNKRVEQFTAEGAFVREFAPPGGFGEPDAIAVDDSTDPLDVSKEDVYVTDPTADAIDKFEADGHYLGEIDEAEAGEPLTELPSVAVDGEGHLWAVYGCQTVAEFSNAEPNMFVTAKAALTEKCLHSGFGIDSEGDFWAIAGYAGFAAKLSPAGTVLTPPGEAVGGEGHHGLAVDPTSNSVYLSSATEVAKYSSGGDELEAFGTGHLSEGEAIAINANTATVYVADVSADAIRAFPAVLLPLVATKPATGLEHEADVTLSGTVNPEGVAVSECKFEYGTNTSYENTVPCSQSPTQIGSGTSPVEVSASVTGVSVPNEYHYRLAATNTNGEAAGYDETFIAASKPEILFPRLSVTSSTEALVTGHIDPDGLATTYDVDYGTSEGYRSATPEASLGAGLAISGISIELHGLSPSTNYHARLVTHNAFGTTEEALEPFTTPSVPEATSNGLPDHRAYELVSPASNPGEVYIPDVEKQKESVTTDYLVRAARDGEAVTYAGDPTATGGSGAQGDGLGDQFVARRNASGWEATDISPNVKLTTASPGFEAFSTELLPALYHEYAGESPQAGASAPAGCEQELYGYGQKPGAFAPLFTSTLTPGKCGEPSFAGASESWTQLFFQDEAPLVADTQARADARSHEGWGCLEGCNLYDASAGALAVVNVLPDGNSTAGGVFGAVLTQQHPYNPRVLSNVVAADGSRAFWTDTEPGADEGHIFVRLNPGEEQSLVSGGECIDPGKACTLPVSIGAATYLAATPDGRYVFYLEAGGLWRDDTDTSERVTVAQDNASVAGLIGTSSDGESVYFVADAALTSTPSPSGEVARARVCVPYEEQSRILRQELEKGEITEEEYQENHVGSEEEEEAHSNVARPHTGCNLYLWHAGTVAFVADLSVHDDELIGAVRHSSANLPAGDWQPNVEAHTSYVTPDGKSAVFTSFHGLAGANNLGRTHEGQFAPYSEIYTYEAGSTPRLVCVSCRPNGASPLPVGTSSEKNQAGTYLPAGISELFAPRWVSEDGSRVFFDSDQSLVPDEPGSEQGVYEWEREGSGTCTSVTPARPDGGCISLLSGTGATEPSYFVEADPSGENVFIMTRKQLAGEGTGERMMLYDVRAGGGFGKSSQACTGTGCQGVPPAAPSFATPPSETFGGAANFAPLPVLKHTSKPPSATQRLASALRACRRHRKREVRIRCEREARGAYRRDTHSGVKKSSKKGHHHA